MKTIPEIELPPRAYSLVESLRDIGYSLRTALADVVDNSITAGAKQIDLLATTHDDAPAIAVMDDGIGMSRDELLEAMRPGTKSPLEERHTDDLGRFGLGLKTASFSQCRRLTVLTRRDGIASSATWDLDTVARRNKWVVELADDEHLMQTRWAQELIGDGTLVVWEKLDRLLDSDSRGDRDELVRRIDESVDHLECVFHRVLTGHGGKKVSMSLNRQALTPFDPFNSNHPATQHHSEEQIQLNGNLIRIWPITLPHRDKVSRTEWEKLAGPEGYVSNQGFYLYRNRRLILHGTWFRLARQLELTKLARVGIDIPNTLDSEWKIDVRKASAQPPPLVRERLRRIIDQMGIPSRRAYSGRGRKLTEESPMPVWRRVQDKNRVSYEIDYEHPLLSTFQAGLNVHQTNDFKRILKFIAATLPLEALHVAVSADPDHVKPLEFSDEEFETIVRTVYDSLQRRQLSQKEIKDRLVGASPFQNDWERTLTIVDAIESNMVSKR